MIGNRGAFSRARSSHQAHRAMQLALAPNVTHRGQNLLPVAADVEHDQPRPRKLPTCGSAKFPIWRVAVISPRDG
jgi:hypothetical protein